MLAVHRNTFEKIHIVGAPLPEEGLVARNAASWAAQKWWEDNLHAKGTSSLTFPMIGRLVELLLRLNPPIRQALRSTYSHVSLDEFQDTTHVQYDLVKTAFLGSGAVLTAVGGNKQQIMRWAMALDDPFGCFEQDFGARRVPLVCNYRSSPELVRIQHHLALAVDAAAVPAQSMVSPQCSENSCVILEFSTPDDEARYLAETKAPTITKDGLLPRDYAFLVKQRADDYESVLAPVFKEYG